MDEYELISVILPIYNSEKYLKRCINSLLNQTYLNLEIIIINDGSTDNSLCIIKEFAEKDNRIIIIDKINEGVSKARNLGIEKAKGDYITFVDADDWLELNAIETLYNELKNNQVDVIRGNYFRNSTETKNDFIGNLYGLENKKFNSKEIRECVINHFLLIKESIPNLVMLLLIKKSLLKNIRFDENLFFMEDVVFYLQILINCNNFYILSKPIYHYYINKESATKSPKKYIKNAYGVIDVNKKISQIIHECNLDKNNYLMKINASNLNTIFYYLYLATNNKIEIGDEIKKLNENTHYKYMIENIDMKILPIKGKIMVNLLINKRITLFKLVCKVNGMIKNIKK